VSDLISVVVISYNSSNYILETLESIKAQTYDNIELIISDDCSSDDTVLLGERWTSENISRFNGIKVIANKKNAGISANLNIGLKECKGKFIKPIAADDILVEDCLERNYKACVTNKYKILFSEVLTFIDNDKSKLIASDYSYSLKCFDLDYRGQNKLLSHTHFPQTQTFFVEKNFLEQVGYFEEEYKYMEDYPMWFKITSMGYKLNFLECVTVLYRVHSESVYNYKKTDKIVNERFHQSDRHFFYNVRLKSMIKYGLIYEAYSQLIRYVYKDIVILLGNKRNVLTYIAKIILLLNPTNLINKTKIMLNKGNKGGI
jgi:glycosyltransferase involved in cell wall biosynthesis